LGPTLLCVLVTLWSDPVELNAGVTAEVRAGESPVIAQQNAQAFVATLVTPTIDLDLKESRGGARLTYYPRLVWQSPNALDRTIRPLLLHQGSLSASVRPTRTTHVAARAFASYGEPDYSILPQLIGASGGTVPVGPGQAAVPQVQTIVTFSGSALLEDQVSRRLRVTLGGGATYFRPIGTPTPAPAGAMLPGISFLSEQTTATLTPGIVERLTRNDDLGVAINGTYSTYSTGIEVALVGPSVSWRARRAAGDELRVELGAAVARDVGAVSAVPGGQAVAPTGSVEALLHLGGEDEYGVWTRLRAAVDEFIDPVLSTVYPRTFVAAQTVLVVAPDWSVGLQADFTTSLRTPSPAMMSLDETAFSVVVPVRHRFGPSLIAELGGRWGERAPAIAASDFAFRERQLWVYVSLTADTRARARWSGR
jgi:hypothetical protein